MANANLDEAALKSAIANSIESRAESAYYDFSSDRIVINLYHALKITHKKTPVHGRINLICVRDISDAVSLRNDRVMFFYYGQFNGHHIKQRRNFQLSTRNSPTLQIAI